MEKEMSDLPERVRLFNSPLETGIRTVILLEAFFPRTFDLLRLTWLDHLVVHTADIDGPPSLHPDLPQRTGELLVRRRLLEEGLNLMRSLHYVDVLGSEKGIHYQTSEEATALIDSMRAGYSITLKHRASWLADKLQDSSDEDIATLVSTRIGDLVADFQGQPEPGQALL